MSAQISPDGLYYWDGTSWVSTLSHDGRSRWNGSQWIPVAGQVTAPSGGYQPLATREPTSWTRPLQYAVAGWYTLSALYTLSLPFWLGGLISQAVNQSVQRQEQLNPSATVPADFASAMSSIINWAVWVGVVFGVALCVVAAVGALKRWTWIYYAVLILLGLGAASLPLNLITAVSGSALSTASGFSMPASITWLGLVTAVPGTALFIWMLVAIIQRGPWGMRRIDTYPRS